MFPPAIRFPLLASLCLTSHVLSQGFEVISGSARITQSGNFTAIENSPHAILQWNEFSIEAQHHLHFSQANAASTVLNRVTGSNLSTLMGTLTSNGQVFLLNPHGVLIGPNAVIQTAGFLASTALLSNDQFLAGKELCFSVPGNGKIINQGKIECSQGNIFLIAKEVINEGVCSADFIGIGSAVEVLIQPQSAQRLYIRPDPIDVGAIVNQGSLEALAIELNTASAYQKAIRIEGKDSKLIAWTESGRIMLSAENGGIEVEGTVKAGSHAQLIGGHLAVAPTGSIDVDSMGMISIEAIGRGIYLEGTIRASQGSLLIKNTSQESPFYNLGMLDVSGPQGGSIHINTTKLLNFGNILADGTHFNGGSIEINTQGPYLETIQGLLSTSGLHNGGTISVFSDTSLFSSGTMRTEGSQGGTISLLAPTLTLVSADLNASGMSQGGNIFVGGGAHGESLGAQHAETTHLSGDTRICVSATDSGNGGTIVVWSEKRTVCYGSIEANAGPLGGDGGWIEVSSKEELFCRAGLRANSLNGSPGSVLLDPKNIVIDAVAGVYPQYEFIDPNAAGGTSFGNFVLPLSTGNVVITKPFDDMGATDAGAVYLYNGHTAALISTITGSSMNDRVGIGDEVIALTNNGNYVFISGVWNNSSTVAANAGAVTWGNGITGVSGIVSSSNSLVGTQTFDQVGIGGVFALSNGNYVVNNYSWANGLALEAGAVTWGDGSTGISGDVSAGNSLVGSQSFDRVGINGITALTNGAPAGNYVVASSLWTNGASSNAGAVTWVNGSTGLTGAVSAVNSLVGTLMNDSVGGNGVVQLTNGNYVVASGSWSNVGAATWGDGASGITGVVSSTNSLVGTTAGDGVGQNGVIALTNGNYVVRSPNWNNGGGTPNAGAATWGDGSTVGPRLTGAVTSVNSLVGTTTSDSVALNVFALAFGNYVVISPNWDRGAATNAGAVTWGDGLGGTVGAVTTTNSLVGTVTNDRVGINNVCVLTNGNYVVSSPDWNDGLITDAGAATWGDGSTLGSRLTGDVTSSNSLIGSTSGDQVGVFIVALTNDNYVVLSPQWDNGLVVNAGAATWGDGLSGITGPVTSLNSLVGSTVGDFIGDSLGITVLTNGNYVLTTPTWNDGLTIQVGAATWGNGSTLGPRLVGTITSSNSLIGVTANDQVGSGGALALTNGNYVVGSPNWDNGLVVNAGAATWGDGSTLGTRLTGVITSSNSLVGTQTNDFAGETIIELSDNKYVVISPDWNMQSGAATWGDGSTSSGGIKGDVTLQNSVAGQITSAGLQYRAEDVVNGTFLCVFTNEDAGKVRIGLQSPNQINFSRAQAQDMTITPSLLTDTLNTGTAVTLQANNDITISSSITSTSPAGALTLSAGRSALINANITTGDAPLTITANDLLSSGVVDAFRDAGDAVLSVANNVTIDTGSAGLTLSLLNGAGKTNSGSGDLTIGDNATLQCTGSGAMTLTAQENNIVLGNNSLLQTANGNLMLSAGVSITDINPVTLQTTGSGELVLITDSLFPTAPFFGNGAAMFPLATLATGGGRLLVYTAQRSLNSVPAVINGTPYVPGPEFVNSVTEKWGTYYPNSSGIPFTIFYKQPAILPPVPPGSSTQPEQAVIANQGTLAELISSLLSQQFSGQLMMNFQVFLDNLLFCDFNSMKLDEEE